MHEYAPQASPCLYGGGAEKLQERMHRGPAPTQQQKGQTKEKWCYIYKHSPTDAGRCGLDKGQHASRKWKIEYQWDKAEYEIVCQVANGSPSYEMKYSSGKVKTPHRNRFFQVAIPQGASTALCQSMYANVDLTTRSAPVEFTPLECDIDLPSNIVEEWLSRRSTSFSSFGQVDGIWRPLPMVVPSTATKDNRDGRRDECASDDEPDWVLPVYFQVHNLRPNFQLWTWGGEDYM